MPNHDRHSLLGLALAAQPLPLGPGGDLDGPLLQRHDRPHAIHYQAGRMQTPSPELWG